MKCISCKAPMRYVGHHIFKSYYVCSKFPIDCDDDTRYYPGKDCPPTDWQLIMIYLTPFALFTLFILIILALHYLTVI